MRRRFKTVPTPKIAGVPTQTLHRYAELRADADGIQGTIVRYGDVADLGPMGRERFEPRSVAWDDVILNIQHDRKQPVARTGAGLEIHDGGDALTLRARLPNTEFGRRARELVDAGILRGLSAEFLPQRDRYDGGMRVIQRALLRGVGLVDRPAYPQSTLARAEALPFTLQCRGPEIVGEIALGEEGVISQQHGLSLIVESGALTLAPSGVFLLRGYDYDNALATTANGNLRVIVSAGAIAFSASRLARTAALRDVRQRIRAKLINGVVPGMRLFEWDDADGPDGTVRTVKRAALCEINLIAHAGLGPVRRRMAL